MNRRTDNPANSPSNNRETHPLGPKKILLLAVLLLGSLTLQAGESKIDLLKGEQWWGVFVAGGPMMPFAEPFERVDLATYTRGQTTPFLVSNRGRYIWSAEPFSIAFTGSSFVIDSPKEQVAAVTAGKSLREAYLVCCHKNFPPQGTTPAEEFFRAPVYDTRSEPEFGFAPTGEQLSAYADQILQAGYPAGMLVISGGWQHSAGRFEPDPALYGDFAACVRQLHDKGFKVMLTITPFVSSDGPDYRNLRQEEGTFLHQAAGNLAMAEWKGGYSALYDFTSPAVFTRVRAQLDQLHSQYGVDGFLFDCTEALPLLSLARGGASDYLSRWSQLGEGYPLCQYTISRGEGLASYIHTLQPNLPFGWEFLRNSTAELIQANLLAYPYTTLSVNGTSNGAFDTDGELTLRYIQLLSVLPVMNIGFAPWKITNQQLAQGCKAAMAERTRLADYYAKLVSESSRTAEPILRHMEYSFPRNGFTDCNDQFMLGAKYLVAPILDKGDSRMVRFPRGRWSGPDGKIYRGPLVVTVRANPGQMLIFELVK